ncbi:L-3-cyanoalanine synthase 1, mitochondrial [Vitis vinifera]|uniref:L-3-cyanoalanine synthase 1, mitochondrial n=1 Tax=Vitis vinifera TaxID=29760 RepID=A0A438EH55_VITVI|nr:L-3-cyanoalanine synthase 1, mitochondrial [Vitis vinifera]
MAALSSFFKRKSSIPFTSLAIRRWFSTQPILDSPSFSQRIRDLPKDLPGPTSKKKFLRKLRKATVKQFNFSNPLRKRRRFKFLRFSDRPCFGFSPFWVFMLIGKTPLVFLNKVTEGCGAYVAVKQEMMQPTASIKDRPALAMITDAENKQLITPGSMAFMAAMKGYKMVLTMPSYTSLERRVTMRAFGADLILTDPTKGMGGTVKKAYELLESTQMLSCFNNFQILPIPRAVFFPNVLNFPCLPGPEIWEDTRGQVDIFIMGIGSGGTVSGVGRYLKSQNPNVKIYGLEPTESNVLNGGKPGPHHITGNGVGFKPDILDMDVMEEVLMVSNVNCMIGMTVSSEDAVNMARQLALKEGLMVGISSGANTVAALRLARRPENKGKLIVTIHPSFGERYLSSVLFQELRKEAENMQPVSVD